ncbi:hypothetical protein CEW88_23640 (plasmid) [Alloyangia pacifica]|uniref:Capsular polysaccharide export protein n=1 Tax=Alloyangia pacifica TaxID=311180 RepID=A0A2U8HLU1_9RHOB|nr:rhamnan synthesis F family protein [Alloyangia pacifica]AWI86758.1 hypothetical protein CEW88_23640 [Alloyangia pacifica]
MRVLFYVEPHPIRNVFTHFKDVAQSFAPLLETGPRLDTRIYANAATFDLLKDALTTADLRLIRSTKEDEAIFSRYNVPWVGQGFPHWLNLMAGTGQIAKDYEAVLERIWRRFPFDVIIHWGENGAVTNFIKDREITRIGMELGCTRPPFFDSLVMDPYGTNGSGIVPKLTVADLREIVEDVPMSRAEAMLAYSQNIEAMPYELQVAPMPGDLLARVAGVEKLAFLPLQLFDDANLLRFSPYQSLRDVVLDAVPKLAAAGYTTIITPHPATKHRPQGAMAESVAKVELRQWADQVIWLEPGETRPSNPQLISLADLTVTVNSSVGFEALYFDKPVVVLGDAIYKPRDLFPTLDEFLAGRFDREAYLDGIGLLRRFFLGGYLQSAKIRSDISSFERRIGIIDRLYRQHGDDAAAVAKGFWRITSASTQRYAESWAFSGQSIAGQQEFGTPVIAPVVPGTTGQAGDQDSTAWVPAARRLLTHSGKSDIEGFSTWLRGALATPEGVATIASEGQILDPAFYLDKYPDVKAVGAAPLAHYRSRGLIERRVPRKRLPGVSKERLEEHLTAAARLVLDTTSGILPEHALTPSEAARRKADLGAIRQGLARSSSRVAVVAHLYYRDLVPELLSRLEAIPEAFDLIVTLPDWGSRRIEAMVREAYPQAQFYHAANRGRDIGPFVDLLPTLLDKAYDAVLKIQTKRGYYLAGRLRPELGDLWRDEAFAALLGSRERVSEILAAFRRGPDVTMVGPEPHYLGLVQYPYHDRGVLAHMAFDEAEAEGFFAGTMFWVRPACLRPLVASLGLSMTSFAAETGANDGALAHVVERLFGHAAEVAGKPLGAPIDPEAPLNHAPQPLAVKMHDRIEQALREQQETQIAQAKSRDALTW